MSSTGVAWVCAVLMYSPSALSVVSPDTTRGLAVPASSPGWSRAGQLFAKREKIDPIGISEKQARKLAKQRFAEGEEHYRLGRFEDALAAYSEAYELLPLGAFLFNIGQCHKQLGDHERAVFFFNGYLRETPDAPNAETVRQLVIESEAALAAVAEKQRQAEESQRRQEEARAAAERAAAEEAAHKAAAEKAQAEAAATQAEADAAVYRQWWFWTALGGAALVAAGGTAAVVAVMAGQEQGTVLPYGSLGTLDTRE